MTRSLPEVTEGMHFESIFWFELDQLHPLFHLKNHKLIINNEIQRFPKPPVPVRVREGSPLRGSTRDLVPLVAIL